MPKRMRFNDKKLREPLLVKGRDFQIFDTEIRDFAVCIYRSENRLRGDAVPKGCQYLFPEDVPGQTVVNVKRFWARMRVQAHIPDVRIHDLRHNRKLYGARKIWLVPRRDGGDVAPSRQICYANRLPGNGCTVERLMRRLGIKGVIRGKKVIMTNQDTSQPCPDDKVNRLFKADRPNKLWVSDFTYVPTWSQTVYVAPRHGCSDQWRFHGSIIDVFARRIVG